MQALFKDLLKSAIITDILGKMPAVKLIFFTMLGMMLLSFLFLSLLSHNSLDPAWAHGSVIFCTFFLDLGHGGWQFCCVMNSFAFGQNKWL